jgi:O-antigen ligase
MIYPSDTLNLPAKRLPADQSKTQATSTEQNNRWAHALFILVLLSLVAPFVVVEGLLVNHASTSYFFRILVELTLPVYAFLVVSAPGARPHLRNPVTLAVLAFFCVNVVSAALGVNAMRSFWSTFERLGGVFTLAHVTLLYFYILALAQTRQLYWHRLILAFHVAASLVALNVFMVIITGNHFWFFDNRYPRVSGTFGNPIFLSSYLIIPVFLAACSCVRETIQWKKALYVLCGALQIYAIVMSATRGAILGLAAGAALALVTYFLGSSDAAMRRRASFTAAACVCALALLVGFRDALPRDAALRRVFQLGDGASTSRLIQWKSALHGYLDNPLLGVGPENYYVIASKYFDPQIYLYDGTWFDKPHNYILEILVTTGALGCLAYLGILALSALILRAAYRRSRLNLAECCALLGALAAYQVQNLFAFDTVHSGAMFFGLTAFLAALWVPPQDNVVERPPTANLRLALASFLLLVPLVLLSAYAGNFAAMRISKALADGINLGGSNPVLAKQRFDEATSLPYNTDGPMSAFQYSNLAVRLAQSSSRVPAQFVNQTLDDAIAYETLVAERTGNESMAWQQLGNLYYWKSSYNHTRPAPQAFDAVEKASLLSPKRMEPLQLKSRLQVASGDLAGAIQTLAAAIKLAPAGYSKSDQLVLQLGMLYAYSGAPQQGVPLAERALSHDYVPAAASEVSWLGGWYANQKDWKNAERIFALAVRADPNSLEEYGDLAKVYFAMGQTSKANAVAQLASANVTDRRRHFDALIPSGKSN